MLQFRPFVLMNYRFLDKKRVGISFTHPTQWNIRKYVNQINKYPKEKPGCVFCMIFRFKNLS